MKTHKINSGYYGRIALSSLNLANIANEIEHINSVWFAVVRDQRNWRVFCGDSQSIVNLLLYPEKQAFSADSGLFSTKREAIESMPAIARNWIKES